MSDEYTDPVGVVFQHPDGTRDDPILCESDNEAWRFLVDEGFSPKITLFDAPTQLFWDTKGSGDVAWILPVNVVEVEVDGDLP